MNERIKELLEKCTDPNITKPWPLIDTEKFANMIINECCDQVRYIDAIEIKTHFGIKD